MRQSHADFAIVGSTPLARLVAGLLASVHGKVVVFAGESQSRYRLPRSIDLSVTAMTRPESWAMLKATTPETLKLIARLAGRRASSRLDPIFFAESAVGKEALAHIRHMAQAFGHAVEPVAASAIGAGRDGLVLRDAVLLHRPALETALDQWLDQLNIRRVAGGESILVHADGTASLTAGEDSVEISQTVLADDAAIIAYLPQAHWPPTLRTVTTTTITTEPTKPIAARVLFQLDSGMTLAQQAGKGITAMGPGMIDPFSAQLAILLGRERAFRQAGQSTYPAVVTIDGAPALGRVRGTGPDVVTGLGPTGAFLAPALARWLAGAAMPQENAWFGARLVDRSAAPSLVADLGVAS